MQALRFSQRSVAANATKSTKRASGTGTRVGGVGYRKYEVRSRRALGIGRAAARARVGDPIQHLSRV